MLTFWLMCLQITCLTIGSATDNQNAYYIVNAPISTTPPTRILPPGYTRFSNIKTAYKIYTDRLNWTSAQEACSTEGARLAVIDTQPKLESIRQIRPWRNWVWTGIHRKSRSGDWESVHGGSISSDLPGIHYIPPISGDCVTVIGLTSLTRLSVTSCGDRYRYACEIPDAV